MKTLSIVFLLLLFFSLTTCKKDKDEVVAPQGPAGPTLRNTLWACYVNSTNDWEKYFYFGQDTLRSSQDSISWTGESFYYTTANLFYISDVSWSIACPGGDTGSYHFSIVSDTLRFTPILDGCGLRYGFLNAHYFVRL